MRQLCTQLAIPAAESKVTLLRLAGSAHVRHDDLFGVHRTPIVLFDLLGADINLDLDASGT